MKTVNSLLRDIAKELKTCAKNLQLFYLNQGRFCFVGKAIKSNKIEEEIILTSKYIEDITDKGYYTNSYHVDVREEIGAFEKLAFESQFQPISNGGCISYVEIPNLLHNVEALQSLVKYIAKNIQYAEFNTKSDNCHECLFEGEMKLTDQLKWECPNCGNDNPSRMNVVRRTCGYLGEHYWNRGKTQEIKNRVLHL